MRLFSDNIKRNFKNSFLFFLPSIFTMMINLFSTPIFAKNMSSYDFAVMGYFNAFQQFFLPIMDMSLFPYYMSGYHKRTQEENRVVINNMIVFLAVSNLIIISLGIVGISIYFRLAKVSFPLFPYVLFSMFTPYFSIFVAALTMNYKMQKKALSFAKVRSVYPILSIGAGLIFVVIFQWGAIGRMGAITLAQAILGIYAFGLLYQRGFKFDFAIIKNALKLGYPLIITAMLQFPINSIDKIFLERLDNIDEFALYNLGLKFSGILMILGASLFQAFEPDFYKYVDQKQWKKLFIVVVVVFGSLAAINVIFNLVSKPIVAFLTSYRYTGAYIYTNIAIWGDLLMRLTYLIAIFYIIYKKTKLLILHKIILAAMALVVWSLFINNWEFIGAVWAKVAINALNVIVMIIILALSSINKKRYAYLKNRVANIILGRN